MPFEISPTDMSIEYDALFACQWAAFTNPPQALWELFFPIQGSEAEAIKAGAARQLQGATPHDQWIKAVDTESGKIVGGALWKFFDENPYAAPMPEFDAVWYPEGELRELCNTMYEGLRVWRPKCVPRPHACQFFLPNFSTSC